jgi:hypothetical protein
LRDDVVALRAIVVQEQVANAELRRLLAAEHHRVRAPVDTTAHRAATQPEAAENAPAPGEPPLRPAVPWWAFWRRCGRCPASEAEPRSSPLDPGPEGTGSARGPAAGPTRWG